MKKKNWILTCLIVFLIAAASLTVGFSSKASSVEKQNNNPTCCQKMKECQPKESGSEEILPDNLSPQFMTIFAFGH